MKLYLVQHGEAVAKELDPERPLTDKGRGDVDKLAAFLGAAGIRVDRVIHSGKLRARQTAELLAASIAPGIDIETSDHINPNDDPAGFDLDAQAADKDMLVVGHLPFMQKLVSHLLVADIGKPLTAYQPGSIVCLEPIEANRWQLNWMLRPELFT